MSVVITKDLLSKFHGLPRNWPYVTLQACLSPVHGSRRGSTQHVVHMLGQSPEDVARAAEVRTPAVTHRYLETLLNRAGLTGGTGATGATTDPLFGCFQAPVMLYFDESTVGGYPTPGPGDFIAFPNGNSFTYHGLLFTPGSTLGGDGFFLVDEQYTYNNGASTGYASSSSNYLAYTADTLATNTFAISTSNNGAIKVISLFVSQPDTTGQSITISGTLGGVPVPGCSGTFLPAGDAGTTVTLDNCFVDTLVLKGNTAAVDALACILGLDTLLACSATVASALTSSP